ncbi:MAG: PQQ-dependent sugar dehydrogenase [Pirellulales bacterium]
MTRLALLPLVALLCLAHSSTLCAQDDAPFGLERRVEWRDSRLLGSPEPPLPYSVEKTFTNLDWQAPIYAIDEPATEFLWVISQGQGAERSSRIERVVDDPLTDERASLFEAPDELVYSVCFDPGYVKNRVVYVFSNGPTSQSRRTNRVSRYTVELGSSPRLDPESQQVILEWRSEGHDGGDLAFGPDGMLYIVTGDGSGDSDTWNSGQTLDDLLGAVLRIDVSRSEGDRLYAIPPDNPFVQLSGARGEVWAYGLRNPWRMTIDPRTGHVWVGNNGQDLWETAHLVQRGDNLGWSVYEGNHPFYPERERGPTPLVPPTIEHSHAEFRSLTGGVVYYGDSLPDLEGAYIYGDYATGRIWGMKHDGQRVVWHRELADTSLLIASFRVDQRGELLVVDHGGGIYRLTPAESADVAAPFPNLLSQTGLFTSTRDHQPAAGVIPFSVNAPGWSDGAIAEHFIAVPGDATVGYTSSGSWSFPDGTAIAQTLSLSTDKASPAANRRIETRVLLRQQGEWAGYSYRWNDDQSDAVLVGAKGEQIELDSTAYGSNDDDDVAWRIPSRTECLTCHSRAANFVLGLSEAQLNRPHDYGGVHDNQLRALDHIGLFGQALPKPPAERTRLVDPYDASADPEARVRAYLHVNCAACHVAAGGGNSQMELGLATATTDAKLLAARPQHDTFGISDAMLIAPGDPDRSVLVHRLSHRGRGQMPPLVSNRVDERAVALVREWIGSLKPALPVVKQWQMEDFLPALDQLTSGRSSEAGQVAFKQTGCVECHRFAGEGGSVGPDLTGVEKRLAAPKLLESIVQPSKDIADQYASYAIETDDGRVVAGRIERETDEAVFVRPHSATDAPTEVSKQSIVERRRLPVSNMPEGTINVLHKEQVLDLLAYLLSGATASEP